MALTAIVLIDTPNVRKSVTRRFGPAARPDYRALIDAVNRTGRSIHAEAIVNAGVSTSFTARLAELGYRVVYSHAEDCDEMLIARGVALHQSADLFVLGSGDGKFGSLVQILQSLGKRVVIAGVQGSVSTRLTRLADAVVEFPVFPTATRVAA